MNKRKREQCISDSSLTMTNTQHFLSEIVPEIERDKGQKNPDGKMISVQIPSTSSNNEDSVQTKKKSVWNDQW